MDADSAVHCSSSAKGRPITTVIAEPVSSEEAANAAAQATSDENAVLHWLKTRPGISVRDIATAAGWVTDNDRPLSTKVHRCLERLKHDKLVRVYRGKWRITEAGKQELEGEK